MPDPADVVCHDSCVKLGRCGRCSWSTCRDDIAFVRVLMQKIFSEYCIDMDLVFAMGQSNGAMFAHRLGQQLVGQLAAIVPVFGLPLLGYLAGEDYTLIKNQAELNGTSVLALHDRQDTNIPIS